MPASVGFWGGIGCLLGRHVRSRGQARVTPQGWVTRCARCAIPMARAHGGGKWQAVKTPKRTEQDTRAEAAAALSKAMARSRKASLRADAKAAKRDDGYIGDRMVEPEWDESGEVAPARAKRRWFGLGRAAGSDQKPKRKRRLPFAGRRAKASEGSAPPLPLIAVEGSEAAPERRRLFRKERARRDETAARPTE